MARDYKPRAKPKKRAPSKPSAPARRIPWWIWVLVGLTPGLGAAYAVHMHHTGGSIPGLSDSLAKSHSEPSTARSTNASRPNSARSAAKREPRTRFEFYSVLPEMEVVVPESEVAPRPRSGNEPQRPSRYFLQAGAFRSLADADRLKASLALSGLEARIQTVAVDGKHQWHRVRLGPYTDLEVLRSTRTRLRHASIDAMVLKIGV